MAFQPLPAGHDGAGATAMRKASRRIIAERERRALLFPHMDEPAWLILVDLLANEGRDISVTSACLASFAPATTALRHIALLEAEGLVTSEPDATDGRRRHLRLAIHARALLAQFFAATPASGNQLSQPPAVSARPDLGHNPSRNDAEGLGSSHVPHGITTSAEGQRHHGL